MEVEVFVGLVLLDKNFRIYLIKENDKHGIGKNRWNLPGGGVDVGEGIEKSAVREGLEETGYQIEPQSILGCYQGSKGDKSWMYIVMKAKLISEEKSRVSDPDIKEGRWFEKEEFLGLDNALLVHADMKAVYKAALEKKGLQLERAKLVDFDKK